MKTGHKTYEKDTYMCRNRLTKRQGEMKKVKISTIILGILFFAIATMIIYGWGVIRQKNQSGDLMKLLFSKGQGRVKKYLKHNSAITLGQAAKLCEGWKRDSRFLPTGRWSKTPETLPVSFLLTW